MSKKKIARILLVLAVVASLTLTELTPLSSRARTSSARPDAAISSTRASMRA